MHVCISKNCTISAYCVYEETLRLIGGGLILTSQRRSRFSIFLSDVEMLLSAVISTLGSLGFVPHTFD